MFGRILRISSEKRKDFAKPFRKLISQKLTINIHKVQDSSEVACDCGNYNCRTKKEQYCCQLARVMKVELQEATEIFEASKEVLERVDSVEIPVRSKELAKLQLEATDSCKVELAVLSNTDSEYMRYNDYFVRNGCLKVGKAIEIPYLDAKMLVSFFLSPDSDILFMNIRGVEGRDSFLGATFIDRYGYNGPILNMGTAAGISPIKEERVPAIFLPQNSIVDLPMGRGSILMKKRVSHYGVMEEHLNLVQQSGFQESLYMLKNPNAEVGHSITSGEDLVYSRIAHLAQGCKIKCIRGASLTGEAKLETNAQSLEQIRSYGFKAYDMETRWLMKAKKLVVIRSISDTGEEGLSDENANNDSRRQEAQQLLGKLFLVMMQDEELLNMLGTHTILV